MGSSTRVSTILLAATLALLAVPVAPAHAQPTGTVRGKITEARTQRPLASVQVYVPGTGRGTLTNSNGDYQIVVGVGAQRVRAELTGYTAAERSVSVGAGQTLALDFQLAPATIALDEVVVTGTAGATQRRALGNAVAQIDASRLNEVAPVANVQQLLNGRAAGVVIQPASGGVGTGARIRIRGSSSFSLSNEPLIYIDGVRINNAPATGPANQAFGSSSISRINDINSEDIESIEVIKGPAAATLYGTEASNGVIQILTKKGSAGRARWTLNVRQGANYLRDPEGRFPVNYQLVDGQVRSLNMVKVENERGPQLFRTGHLQEYDLSASGGTELFRYYASGGFENSDGVEPSNSLRRYTGRLNLTLTPSDKLDVGGTLSYIDGLTDLSAEAGFGGRVWSTVLADPRNLNERRRGFHSGLPEEYDLLYNFSQGLRRTTGTLRLDHRPAPWFSQRLAYGTDVTNEDNIIFFPRVDSLVAISAFGNEALGYKEVNRRTVTYNSLDYSATAHLHLREALSSSTSLGAQYYRNSLRYVYGDGSIFPAPGLSALSATTVRSQPIEDSEENVTLGIFAQQEFGWRDRLYLTVGLRADDNSAFGQNFDRVYYPKYSASWVLSEEPFWPLRVVNTLKLRAAYGESGKQPETFAALRTYAPEVGPGDSPAVRPDLIGNPDLGPERGKELEVGFDAGFFGDRFGLEFTYYDKRTEDAILQREMAPSAGFAGFQFFNAGEIRNRGVEVLARARPIERRRLAWELTLNVATNDNEVLDLGQPGLRFVTAGTFLRHQVGYPVGGFFEKKVVSATLDGQGNAVDVQCDNGQGGAMPCAGADARYGTADDAPAVYLGRTVPEVESALGSTFTFFDRLRLYTLLDYKGGHRKIDGNTRVRCTFFGGRCRENFFPQEFDPKRIAAIQSSRNLVDFLIDDATFLRLREVALAYDLPAQWLAWSGASRTSVSVAGRNLHTWTNYGGLEPEAMFLGGSRGGNHSAWEQTTLPQLSQWLVSLNLSF